MLNKLAEEDKEFNIILTRVLIGFIGGLLANAENALGWQQSDKVMCRLEVSFEDLVLVHKSVQSLLYSGLLVGIARSSNAFEQQSGCATAPPPLRSNNLYLIMRHFAWYNFNISLPNMLVLLRSSVSSFCR